MVASAPALLSSLPSLPLTLLDLPNEIVGIIIKSNTAYRLDAHDYNFEARRRVELISYSSLSPIWRYESQLELFFRPEILGEEGVERLLASLEISEGRLDGFVQELSIKKGKYGEVGVLEKLFERLSGVKELEMTQLEVCAETVSLLSNLTRLHLTHVTLHPSESSTTLFHSLEHLHLFNCHFSPAALRLFTPNSFPCLHSLKLFNVNTIIGFMLPALGTQIRNLSISTIDLSTLLFGNLLNCLTGLTTLEFVNTKAVKIHAVLLQLPIPLINLRIVTNSEFDWTTLSGSIEEEELVAISRLESVWIGQCSVEGVGMEELERVLMKREINLEREIGRDEEFVEWLKILEQRKRRRD